MWDHRPILAIRPSTRSGCFAMAFTDTQRDNAASRLNRPKSRFSENLDEQKNKSGNCSCQSGGGQCPRLGIWPPADTGRRHQIFMANIRELRQICLVYFLQMCFVPSLFYYSWYNIVLLCITHVTLHSTILGTPFELRWSTALCCWSRISLSSGKDQTASPAIMSLTEGVLSVKGTVP